MRDAMGNQSFQTYERHGKIGTQIDAEGGLQYSSYNQFGERVKLTQKVTGGVDLVTDYSYDMLGRVATTSVANVKTYALDDTMAGNGMNVVGDGTVQTLTTRYVYDQLGRRVAIVDSAGGESRTRYDLDGNVVATGDQTGIGLTYSYDAFHHKILEVDGMGMTLSWQYDDEAKLVRYTDMSNAVVLYGYDGLGRKITQTSSARGTDGLQQNLLFSYDKAGLLARIEDRTSRQVTTYEYDLAGNRVHEKTVIVETKPATAAVILPTDPDAVTITELYEVLLGRHPDPAGLEYWRGRYNGIRGGMFGTVNTVAKLAEIMLTSDEARETFKSDGSVEQFVDKLFSVAVGRQPSATQRASYISQFDNGYDRRGRVVMQFLSDLRPAEREVLNAKIDAALHPVARPAQDVETVVQDNRIEFDDLGRMRVVEDMRSHVEFYYDANGNRLEVRSSYRTAASGYIGVEGDLVENDVFNTYDKANRQLFVNAVKVNGALEIGKYGHKLSYDSAGQRISDTYRRKTEDATTVVTDNYGYDNAGRMTTTTREDYVIDLRQYDVAGRLLRSGISLPRFGFITYHDYENHLKGWDIASNTRTFNYDAAGRILRQKERDIDGKQLNDIKYVNDGYRTTPMGYDNAGRLRGYVLIPAHSELTEQYNYSIKYSFMDSAQQSSITVKRDNTVRTTTNAYDQNGNLIRVTAPRVDTEVEINRVYVNDASGHVLRMTAGSEVTSSLVVNDQLFASYGGAGADAEHGIFANTFTSATDVLAGGTSQSVYVVQSASETLQTIAKMVWGDTSLWYLIADANGLSSETLTVGMPLQIPTRVSAVRNDYASFKPYDRSSIDGGITPSLPAPPGKGGCGPVGTIVVIVVACILNAFMPGAGTVLGQIFIGAVSSAVGQMAAIEAGEQDRFSWKAVALSAASAGMAEGVAENMVGHELFDSAVANKAFNAAVANAMTQGVGVAMHWQEHFQWRGVAAAAASAGAGEAVSGALKDSAFAKTFGTMGVRAVAGLGSGAASAIARGGRIRFGGALADAFGNVLGASLRDAQQRDASAALRGSEQPLLFASLTTGLPDNTYGRMLSDYMESGAMADFVSYDDLRRLAYAADRNGGILPARGDAAVSGLPDNLILESVKGGSDISDLDRARLEGEIGDLDVQKSRRLRGLQDLDELQRRDPGNREVAAYIAKSQSSLRALNANLRDAEQTRFADQLGRDVAADSQRASSVASQQTMQVLREIAEMPTPINILESNVEPTAPELLGNEQLPDWLNGLGGRLALTDNRIPLRPAPLRPGGSPYLPRQGTGRWTNPARPGNSGWISNKPTVIAETGGKPVQFRENYAKFTPFAREKYNFKDLTGNNNHDFAKAYKAIAEKHGMPNPSAAKTWLADNGLMLEHNPNGVTLEVLRANLHNSGPGITHAGGASNLRNWDYSKGTPWQEFQANRLAVGGRVLGGVGMAYGAYVDGRSLYSEYQTSAKTGNYSNTYNEGARITAGWAGALEFGAAGAEIGATWGALGGPVGVVAGGIVGSLIGGGLGYWAGSTIAKEYLRF